MVTLTGELVSPLLAIFIPLLLILFAFHKEIANKNMKKLFYGMFYGIGIYGSLMFASYSNNPKTYLEAYAHFMTTTEGATIYAIIVGIIGAIALIEFIAKKEATGFIAGLVLSFSIFEVYFAIRCVETIPLMESILKHVCD